MSDISLKIKSLPSLVFTLGELFEKEGFELVLVGGTVRDLALGKDKLEDLDFATNATPEQTTDILRSITGTIWDTGARFGTISAELDDPSLKESIKVEITTYRSEVYTPGDRHPEVSYGDNIKDDLIRRDFTVNAIGIRVPSGDVVDPFDGLEDIDRKVLRTPTRPVISFSDDPLRMMRLCRFVSTLGFEPDNEALEAATLMSQQIENISAERVKVELEKLVVGKHADRGLDLLCKTGIADYVLPELPALAMERDPLHHHKDVYTHTLAVVMGCPPDMILRMAALLHDIGKPQTREFHDDGTVSFHQHDIVGARMARHRLRELTFSKKEIREISELVRLHLRFHGYSDGEWTDAAVRRYVNDCETDEQFRRLNLLTRADVTTNNKRKAQRFWGAMDHLEERVEKLREQDALAAVRPALDGGQIMAYLGLKPGPDVGKVWTWMKDQSLEYGPMTEEQAYERLDFYAQENGLDIVGKKVPKTKKKKDK